MVTNFWDDLIEEVNILSVHFNTVIIVNIDTFRNFFS